MRKRLAERRPRAGCVIGSLLGGAAFAWVTGCLCMGIVPLPRIAPAVAESAMEREKQAAARIGLTTTLERTEELRSSDDREIEIPVSAGECVAFMAACSGSMTVESLRIADASGRTLVDSFDGGGVSRHAQWCATRNASWKAILGLQRTGGIGTGAYREGTLRYAIARGRPAALFMALDRARPVEAVARAMPSAQLFLVANRRSRDRPRPNLEVSIRSYRARLIPESRATYAQLHVLAQNETSAPVSPRFDPLPASAPAHWRPRGAGGRPTARADIDGSLSDDPDHEHPAVGYVEGEARRVLAVVDPSIFPRCATIQFVRMVYGYTARVQHDDGSALTRDRNVAEDIVCAGLGVRTYLVPTDDQERYVVRIYEN